MEGFDHSEDSEDNWSQRTEDEDLSELFGMGDPSEIQ